MSTTTIRLSDELKARVQRLAEAAGTTPHSFILEAVQDRVLHEEEFGDLTRVAHERFEEFERTGEAIPWEEARQYMLDLAAGKVVVRPKARKLTG